MQNQIILYNGPNSPFGRKTKITSLVQEITLEEKIIKEYTNPVKGNRKKLLNYFTEKKLRELTENIGEF